MGCSSVCSIKACRSGADSGPRFLRVLTSMLGGSVKMSPGVRILQFLSTGHCVASKLVAWSPFAKDGRDDGAHLDAKRLPRLVDRVEDRLLRRPVRIGRDRVRRTPRGAPATRDAFLARSRCPP